MRTPKILTTMQTYSWGLFRADIIAGITVALVALPLSIAIALASGADPAVGLVTAVIGGFFISLLGGSRVQIGGPTGAFIVVVAAVIAEHGYAGLVTATFMAGIMLLAAGYFRLGRLIAFIPEAVINGFTLGIAVIIASSQVGDALGMMTKGLPADFIEKVQVLWERRDTAQWQAGGIALMTIISIYLLRKYFPRFPGLIFAIAGASAAAFYLHLPIDTIQSRYGELPHALPAPQMPVFSLALIRELFPSAVIIAFLAGVESLLSAIVADRMIDGKHRPNAELLAQGGANIMSSLFGGLPATGAIARTATNIKAGGKTPVAGVSHAVFVFIIMSAFASVVSLMAMPALAALLLFTAWNMSEPHKWRGYMAMPKTDVFLLLLTFALTVMLDLTIAIGVGVTLGLIFRLRDSRKNPPDDWQEPQH